MGIADGLSLRWYEAEDLPQLRDLHRCCFPAEGWKHEDFVSFAGHRGRNNVVKVLVDHESTVYGAVLYTLEPDACRVRRVSVWPDYRRKGYGRSMVDSLCGARSPIRRKLFLAKVREDDLATQLFFRDGLKFSLSRGPRSRDEELKLDFYEFSYVKTGAPTAIIA